MPLDPGAVGTTTDPVEAHWTSTDALLYAVGIGGGTDELAFTTENTAGVDQRVFPTFAVVVGWGRGPSPLAAVGSFDPAMLVHGQQAVTLHAPIPVEGTAILTTTVVGVYDKGAAGVVVTSTKAALGDVPLFTTRSSVFIRGAGGFGGERGPSGARHDPPDRAPDDEASTTTSPDQALRYRLSGDRNPLHSDPSFAARAGFDRPILHGLCTYGFTGRALLHHLCGSDPARFLHVEGRFAAPVFPGEELTVRMWVTAPGEAVFTTAVGDRTVIDQGLLRYR